MARLGAKKKPLPHSAATLVMLNLSSRPLSNASCSGVYLLMLSQVEASAGLRRIGLPAFARLGLLLSSVGVSPLIAGVSAAAWNGVSPGRFCATGYVPK